MSITRRELVHALGAAGSAAFLPPAAAAQTANRTAPHDGAPEADRTVYMSGDGIPLSTRAFTALLDTLTRQTDIEEDNYLLGGDIARFEQEWATLLGKETAVFMPSGTLANQLALRVLAGSRRRVIVPEMSHVYNDTGDACQTLSGLTLLLRGLRCGG